MDQAQRMEWQQNNNVHREEEVTTMFLRNLSKDITRWEELASRLGLSDAKVFDIKEDYRGNNAEIKYQMLLAWKQKKGRDATYGALTDALEAADMKKLADEIKAGTYTEGLR